MQSAKRFIAFLAVVMVAAMLTGCLEVEMKVNSDGSCDVTCIIDVSQLEGMMSESDVENAIQESVENINDTAGKTIAKLISVKENRKEGTMTATISITNLNEMGDGSFFGTVKQYRQQSGAGLDDMMDKKGKKVDEANIPDNLYLVYSPMTEGDAYGLIDVTVIVPGSIEYLTSGGEIRKNNEARFSGMTALVVFKKSGGGFPYWIVFIAAAIFIIFLAIKKKPTVAAVVSPPVTTHDPISGAPADSYAGSGADIPGIIVSLKSYDVINKSFSEPRRTRAAARRFLKSGESSMT